MMLGQLALNEACGSSGQRKKGVLQDRRRLPAPSNLCHWLSLSQCRGLSGWLCTNLAARGFRVGCFSNGAPMVFRALRLDIIIQSACILSGPSRAQSHWAKIDWMKYWPGSVVVVAVRLRVCKWRLKAKKPHSGQNLGSASRRAR